MEITTIEQRAERYANDNWTLDEAFNACEDGYIKGANDQQAIDTEKACEWLGRAIEQWNNAERHRTFFINKDGAVRNFRKAMLNNKH